jgi:hypothetical protein
MLAKKKNTYNTNTNSFTNRQPFFSPKKKKKKKKKEYGSFIAAICS